MATTNKQITIEETVLNQMREHSCYDGIMTPYSAKWVSKRYEITKYKAGKILNSLKDKGLIEYTHFAPPCDYEYEAQTCYCDNHLPYWGYTVIKQLQPQTEQEDGK